MQTAPVTITDGTAQTWTIPHGLTRAPSFIRTVIRCKTADANIGMVPGQEIAADTAFGPNGACAEFGVIADPANLILSYRGDPAAQVGFEGQGNNPTTGTTGSPVTFANFALVAYYSE